jgi:Zn-dependent peptidase ImmA (M78 family)/DNA-binding XRE family transcriptional regulator
MSNALSKKIAAARKDSDLSMDELASLLGVSKQTVYKYESDLIKPSPEVLSKLSILFAKELSYFFSDKSSNRLEKISFRNEVEEAAIRLAEIEAEAIKVIECHFELEDLSSRNREFKNPLKDCTIESLKDLEQAAELLRSVWELGAAPISSVIELLESKNIIIIEHYSHYHYDGFSAFYKNRPVILLNTRIEEVTRKRFTALHELGHILLQSISEELSPKIEEICDAFAGALLMPQKVLKSFWEERNSFLMQDFVTLKESYGISILALWMRAKHLGFIDWDTFHKWKELYYLEKDHGKYVGKEIPKRLEKLLLRGVSEGLIPIKHGIKIAKSIGNSVDKLLILELGKNLKV